MKVFSVSLCCNGILGGGMYVDDEKMVYRTNKLTVSDKYRNLKIYFDNISSISCGRLLFFPTVTVELKTKESYKFIVFKRKKFVDILVKAGVQREG